MCFMNNSDSYINENHQEKGISGNHQRWSWNDSMQKVIQDQELNNKMHNLIFLVSRLQRNFISIGCITAIGFKTYKDWSILIKLLRCTRYKTAVIGCFNRIWCIFISSKCSITFFSWFVLSACCYITDETHPVEYYTERTLSITHVNRFWNIYISFATASSWNSSFETSYIL